MLFEPLAARTDVPDPSDSFGVIAARLGPVEVLLGRSDANGADLRPGPQGRA